LINNFSNLGTSVSDLDPEWIQIQLGPDPASQLGPDPARQAKILPPKQEIIIEISCLKSLTVLSSFYRSFIFINT
jgi:hypothetical protein